MRNSIMSAEYKFRRYSLSLLAVCVTFAGGAACAQDVHETVATRSRDNLDAEGGRVGAFRYFPSVSLERSSNSNVFAAHEDPASDTVLALQPRVEFQSDWTRSALNGGAETDVRRYSAYRSEDQTNSRLFLNGRLDTASNGALSADFERRTDHEDRDSPDDPGGDTPTKFIEDYARFSYLIEPGRVFGEVGVSDRSLDFNDVSRDGSVLNNDDRDRDLLARRFRIGLRLSEGYSVYFEHRLTSLDYDLRLDDFGFNRNAHGRESAVGATFTVAGVVFGEAFIGTKSRHYDDPRLTDIGGGTYGVDLAWNITPLTTLNVEAGREIQPTTVVDAAGIDSSRYRVWADHELLRDLILTLERSVSNQSFVGSPRRDEYRSTAFSARYLMNRHLQVRFAYRHRDRLSTAQTNFAFSRRLISIELVGQL